MQSPNNETQTASEYLSRCPYQNLCGDVVCSPWGMMPVDKPDLNGKRLLIVGLNGNDSSDYGSWEHRTRKESSDALRELLRKDIQMGSYRCLSNLMEPVARFLTGGKDKSSPLAALDHLTWCNVISCCPAPDADGKLPPSSRPTKSMYQNCLKRLLSDDGHCELLNRLLLIRPTHVLVVGRDAESFWKRGSCPGKALGDVLNQIQPKPLVAFVLHPSLGWQRRYPRREDYWEHVVSELSGSRA